MKKALIMTSVAFLLLLAVVAAGLNVIFTVTYIDASFSTISVQGEEEAKALKKELDEFVGDSMTFLDLSDIEETVEKYPCFRVERVNKKFPKTVEVVVKERKELFAYKTEDGNYAMIDSEGQCIRVSDENVSRTGGENIILKNFRLNVEVGERAEGDYFDALLKTFSGFAAYIADARTNIREVTLLGSGDEENPLTNRFNIEMQEGVFVELYNPLSYAEEKAKRAIEEYDKLGDVTRMYGCITVTEVNGAPGTINAAYMQHRVEHDA
ncbi:MAG: FtsQ-type POTRA domain-containing protein [Clostridia bacterium]|nr:FtsQ-type POTRA domain-containing protein [Clostridia bacterium]